MTPEERELVADLFNRLAELERTPRDPDAERAIRDGLARAPNAVYALVQTALLQDEALKVADQRIAEMEEALAQAQPTERRSGSFLENMRDNLLGREPSRGSVPPVGGDRPMGTPPGYGRDRDPWGRSDQPMAGGPGYGGQGYGGPGGPGYGGPGAAPMAGGGGGSFLGTAAAAAAGAVGGGLLMNSIRGMLGGQSGSGPFSGAFDQLSGRASPGGDRSPSAGGGDLSRDAGVGDIGQGRRAGFADVAQNEDAQDANFASDDEEEEGDFDDDDSFEDDTDRA